MSFVLLSTIHGVTGLRKKDEFIVQNRKCI